MYIFYSKISPNSTLTHLNPLQTQCQFPHVENEQTRYIYSILLNLLGVELNSNV